jgi:hypothetical protein
MTRHYLINPEIVNGRNVFQKISVLVRQCGRIQAGHVDVVRMKSFIIGKGKGLPSLPGQRRLHALFPSSFSFPLYSPLVHPRQTLNYSHIFVYMYAYIQVCILGLDFAYER